MTYHCETEIVADRLAGLDGLLTGAGAPTRATWAQPNPGGYSFSDLTPAAQAFVQSRNLLEGNAAQCCRCALAPVCPQSIVAWKL